MKEKEGARFHYAWVILVCCCLSMGSAIGITNNCIGLFYTPVSQELGCRYSDLSLTITLTCLANCTSLLLLTKRVCIRFPLRIVMFLASLCNVPRLLLSFSTAVWQWWVVAVFSGIAGSFLHGFASSIMLERWFKKCLSLALSIAGCFSGVFGIIMSYIIGHMITSVGWRSANMVGSIVLLTLTVIPCMFVSLDPKEKGKKPYGSEVESPKDIPTSSSFSSSEEEVSLDVVKDVAPSKGILLAIMAICLADAIYAAFIFHLTSFGVSIKITLFDVSMITTIYMVGNLLYKSMFGAIEGRIGFRKTSSMMFWSILVGLVIMTIGNQYIVLFGSLLFGASACVYTCIIPLLGRQFYDSEQYPAIMQKCLIAVNLLVSLIGYVYGFVYDKTGSYMPIMITMILASVYSILVLRKILK